jgi:DNA polymerase (family 10)
MADRREEIASKLRELMELSTLDEGPGSFRSRAYENAMHEISSTPNDVEALTEKELTKLPGIGKSTAKRIREYLDTGKITRLEELRQKYPPPYVQMSKIPGLGPKSLKRLRDELGIENLEDLKRALDEHTIRELPGFGEKSEEKLLKAIERMGVIGKDVRHPIAAAMPLARRLVSALEALPGVTLAQYCGSLRRLRESIADIDIVVAADDAAPIMQAFVELPEVGDILARGETKTSVITDTGIQVDVRVVTPAQIGAAMLYFTGSKSHNIALRMRAMDRGWLLNEYGLIDNETQEVIASETEAEIYKALELEWVEPPMREDHGEVELAASGELPQIADLTDMLGDLHVHTSLSGDGRSPLEAMVAGAASRGYRYMAITDHAEDLAINGVPREKLLEQREVLATFGDQYPDLQLLWGCELNIGPDGGLDYDHDFRMSMDWCVAAVHSHFDLSQAEQTARVIRAMEDPAVNVIGHLSGRMIGKRPGIELDIDAILEAAVETQTAIEINSALPRLDAAAEVLLRARDIGVIFVISTDAHHTSEMDRMQWGTKQSARGFVDKSRVANTWSRDEFLHWAAGKRERQ